MNRQGRIVQRVNVHEDGTAHGTAPGPRGSLWMIHPPQEIVRVMPNGQVKRYGPARPRRARVESVTPGARGSLWILIRSSTGGLRLRHVTPSGRRSRSFPAPPSADHVSVSATASGPDGRLWFVTAPAGARRPRLFAARASGRVARYGVLSRLATTSDLARGPDGTLWLTSGNRFWKISRNGKVRPFRLRAPVSPASPLVRVGKRMWVVNDREWGTTALAEITARGRVTSHVLRGVDAGDPNLRFGTVYEDSDLVPDGAGNLWLTQPQQLRVALVSTRAACGVPDLIDLTPAAAQSALTRAGCRARIVGQQSADTYEPRVIRQDRARNTIVAPGTMVTATLGQQRPPCHMPLGALTILDSDDAVIAMGNLSGGRTWIGCHKRVGQLAVAAPADEKCSSSPYEARDLSVVGTHVLAWCAAGNRYTLTTAVVMTWNDLTGAAPSQEVLTVAGDGLSLSSAATAGGDVAWLLSGHFRNAPGGPVSDDPLGSSFVSRVGLWRNGETTVLDEATGFDQTSLTGRSLLGDLRIDGDQVRWRNRDEQRSAPVGRNPTP